VVAIILAIAEAMTLREMLFSLIGGLPL